MPAGAVTRAESCIHSRRAASGLHHTSHLAEVETSARFPTTGQLDRQDRYVCVTSGTDKPNTRSEFAQRRTHVPSRVAPTVQPSGSKRRTRSTSRNAGNPGNPSVPSPPVPCACNATPIEPNGGVALQSNPSFGHRRGDTSCHRSSRWTWSNRSWSIRKDSWRVVATATLPERFRSEARDLHTLFRGTTVRGVPWRHRRGIRRTCGHAGRSRPRIRAGDWRPACCPRSRQVDVDPRGKGAPARPRHRCRSPVARTSSNISSSCSSVMIGTGAGGGPAPGAAGGASRPLRTMSASRASARMGLRSARGGTISATMRSRSVTSTVSPAAARTHVFAQLVVEHLQSDGAHAPEGSFQWPPRSRHPATGSRAMPREPRQGHGHSRAGGAAGSTIHQTQPSIIEPPANLHEAEEFRSPSSARVGGRTAVNSLARCRSASLRASPVGLDPLSPACVAPTPARPLGSGPGALEPPPQCAAPNGRGPYQQEFRQTSPRPTTEHNRFP